MGLDKITLSLYDFFGYLLPGYIMFVAASVAEATFTNYNFFALTRLNKNLVLAAAAAYFMGQIAHAIAATFLNLKFKFGEWRAKKKSKKERSSQNPNDRSQQIGEKSMDVDIFEESIRQRVREVAKQTYGIEVGETDPKAILHTYMLADTYVVASGGLPEREMLTAREGFFKTTVVAFAVLALSLIATLAGHPRFQFGVNVYADAAKPLIGGFAFVSLVLALLFLQRFNFFNRAKNNTALLAFLARRVKASAP